MARLFITGATGFVGGALARQLVTAGHEVVALVRDLARAGELARLGVTLSQGDVTVRDSMRAPMAGVDGIFHVAGWYQIGARDRSAGQTVNVEGTRNVLELVGELGVPKAVYTSTVNVFGDTRGRVVDESYRPGGPWVNEYDRTKWMAHYQVAEPMTRAGLPLVIVQPSAVYGPGDPSPVGQALRDYVRRRLPMVPRRTAFCWGHVEDIARGHRLAMERGRAGESYIIAGPAHSIEEALRIAARITGIPPPRLRMPPALLKALARAMAPIERLVPIPAEYSAEYLRTSAGVTYLVSAAKAIRELGFTARPLEEGLRETLAYEAGRLGGQPASGGR